MFVVLIWTWDDTFQNEFEHTSYSIESGILNVMNVIELCVFPILFLIINSMHGKTNL